MGKSIKALLVSLLTAVFGAVRRVQDRLFPGGAGPVTRQDRVSNTWEYGYTSVGLKENANNASLFLVRGVSKGKR